MTDVPLTSADFDRAYRMPFTFWGDIRIPPEIKILAQSGNPKRALELGCGLGRLTRYMAKQGLKVTSVDFSPVAVEQARQKTRQENLSAEFLVGDVTRLDKLSGPFDISFDVGCFHCLDAAAQQKYVAEVFRLLKPGGTHLILGPGFITEQYSTFAGSDEQDFRASLRVAESAKKPKTASCITLGLVGSPVD